MGLKAPTSLVLLRHASFCVKDAASCVCDAVFLSCGRSLSMSATAGPSTAGPCYFPVPNLTEMREKIITFKFFFVTRYCFVIFFPVIWSLFYCGCSEILFLYSFYQDRRENKYILNSNIWLNELILWCVWTIFSSNTFFYNLVLKLINNSISLERSGWPRIRWCGIGGFQEQVQCLFVGLVALSFLIFNYFPFLFFSSVG